MEFDDDIYLRENPLLTDARTLTYFTDVTGFVRHAEALGLNPDIATNVILRPVAYASFGLNHLIGGFQPSLYRLVNVAIHGLNAWLIFSSCARCWVIGRRI